MSKKFEYPIERFIYNDDYTNEDIGILELDSNDLQNIVEQENKAEEKVETKDDTIAKDDTAKNEEKEDEIISNKDTVE